MSFFNRIVNTVQKAGKSFASSVSKSGVSSGKKSMENIGKQMSRHEQRLKNVKSNINKMDPEQLKKFERAKKHFDERKKHLEAKGISYNTRGDTVILNKTLQQWDRSWSNIGSLNEASLSGYNKVVGLYRLRMSGEIVYVGRAIELYNGGFRKRLSDYRRKNDSGRKHKSGQAIHGNINNITAELLITGNDDNAVEATKALEIYFIGKYLPDWNVNFG